MVNNYFYSRFSLPSISSFPLHAPFVSSTAPGCNFVWCHTRYRADWLKNHHYLTARIAASILLVLHTQ